MQVEQTMRQWNFTALEWVVRDVHALRDYVEQTPTVDPDNEGSEEPYELLRESPLLGDKFKLEIVNLKHHLSLYITCLTLDHLLEYDVTMLVAVKVQDDRGGERGARADWVWECWDKDWSFRLDSEVWQCTLPPLSALLQNPRIAETDSFVICIQIHNPIGPIYPQHPSAYYVPKDLLDGVEASLDNSRDVKFICLERRPSSSTPPSPMFASTHSRRSLATSESSAYSFTTDPKGRKRVIYAHSDILVRRSEYFRDMLGSSFAETQSNGNGEGRKVYEVVVEEADFVSIYWLLKYCYANWVLFKEQDDPRAAVEWIGEGWSTKWLSKKGGEWEWESFSKPGLYHDDDAAGSVVSRDDDVSVSVRSTGVVSPVSARSGRAGERSDVVEGKQPVRTATTPTLQAPPASPRVASRLTSPSTPTTSSSNTPRASSTKPSSSTTSTHKASSSSGAPSRTSTYTYPLSPRQPRAVHPAHPTHPHPTQTQQAQLQAQLDPHAHPTPQPQPASALSLWLIAHRYAMPGLEALALAHMMNTIQPAAALPLLLATTRWDELHDLVEDYIVDHWDIACASEEFDRCCQEVAAGEWGPEGGKTFAALFRRLRSR
ncbi:hypothetical protein M422DRAFT_57400 [Sphaerobolus stellatus SS14]|nr:hypothetical protein M422DRAFT_57400 [Sphaerobolus stellatus SS14]